MALFISRRRSVCFTGHRPEKLTRSEADIQRDLETEIRQAITDGITAFISGMAGARTCRQRRLFWTCAGKDIR